MGKGIRYTDEFRQEAVNQVEVHDYPVYEVSQKLGYLQIVCMPG
jgi:transposase